MRPRVFWSKINQSFHQKRFSWTSARAIIWLRLFFADLIIKTKPSIPLPVFFCICLYRSAYITVTLFVHHLFWHLFWVLELPGLVILFCTVGSVQSATCYGFQQGSSWNTQWVSVWFLVLLWNQQWSTAGCSEKFLCYTVGSV